MRNVQICVALLAAGLLFGACQRRPAAAGVPTAAAAPDDGCIETDVRADIASQCMACVRKNAITPGKDGCCGIADTTGRQLCEAVAKCMRNGMVQGKFCNVGGDTSTCYCGTHQANCWDPGVANGPCMAVITAAAGRNIETLSTDTPNADTILNRYGDVKYALGRASNVASIAGGLCGAECEIKK